jgi:hypothetical protein
MTLRVAFGRACWRASRRAVRAGAFPLILGSPAFAHHPGGASNAGGAGPIVTMSASTMEAGHGAVAFIYEYIRFGGLGDADLIRAAGSHIHAHSIGNGGISGFASFGVPIVNQMNGLQSKTEYRVLTGISCAF